MSIIKFLKSKVFFKQVAIAIIASILLCYLALAWLKSYTNHNEFIEVPDLKGKTVNVANIELSDKNLSLIVQDSANFNPKYPKYSVIEQKPKAGALVKEHRKIYLVLNPSGYKKVKLPNVIRRRLRQAVPTLQSLGLIVNDTVKIDDIGKDEVIKIKYKGNVIKPGTKLKKNSTIQLVVGNGKRQ